MPMKGTSRSGIARQWQLLRLIPQRAPGITVTEIGARLSEQGFVVSRRTIQRDLIDLSAIFPLCCSESENRGNWWASGQIIKPSELRL